MLNNLKQIHFVGIGGAGMSAIAKVLLEKGYDISGSDLNKSETTDKLETMGARIFIGHSSKNLKDSDAVVVSTAIRQDNPEIIAAKDRGLPVFHRSDILAELMNASAGIAVAGAHGKTTTTSMVAIMLEKAGVDPTILIGGELDYLGGNAKLGRGKFLVAEADESDGSFLKFAPKIAIVTNIENDHMDFYGTMDNILHTFNQFLLKLSSTDGLAVLCFDNEYIREIASGLERPYISYGIDYPAEYTARNISTQGALTVFEVYRRENYLGTIRLNIPGRHNIANALAAIVVGENIGLDFAQIAEGLSLFNGAKRRFQTKGRINGVWVVDDYAHHPTEIATTLQAARQTQPKRLICVFQPHRYSRTKFLRREFGGAFTSADLLVLTDVYSAGETQIPGINGETIKEEVECQTGNKVVYIQDRNKIACYLSEIVEPGDLVMTMGAGNIYLVGEELVETLNKSYRHQIV
ncbi:UDP-N-acetylmuramate--L-alanine ligase|uniref:UDP-N-acetylmuramate--L-alanine ligase n=1 Tax=Dendrosporobacter quercicolus TaxID=146817 RepID=A0A1G9MCT7_9FIRM|nr:UDP-N-acetylmuramate--L-alanine ligase [Dendrosporobacter quercicolus]NSL47000.1 UDP-N-acetylmuramate--L-alanine ligase [Dendrosporobacter quercicolus DSM 1736]SDL72090.1 UDP-N-acetylmuramate--L-alanine ligase [Dendrosporobacter quercicolus]